MKIKNRKELVSRGNRKDRTMILQTLEAALSEVSPINLLEKKISYKKGILTFLPDGTSYNLEKADKVIVVGAGKASGYLAESVERILGPETITTGLVNVLKGTADYFHTKKIEINEATHPTPNKAGVEGAKKILSLVRRASSDSVIICLISGGGSSLLPLPPPKLSLSEEARTTELLLKSGASIDELNCVRKHISLVKGGQLVKQAKGSPRFLSFIISDVVGDALGSIASGPTAPDPTTFADALAVLKKYDLLAKVPKSVRAYLAGGMVGKFPETPKPGDKIFRRVANRIIASNRDACGAAVRFLAAKMPSSPSLYLGSSWHGDADLLAQNFSGMFCFGFDSILRTKRFISVVWGGEATVKVKGRGKGGRNQEEALVCLTRLSSCNSRRVTAAFFGTDGIDGNTTAAGAIVDQDGFASARRKRLDPQTYLENNDSNGFFSAAKGHLIITGPTGTNVNDIGIAIVRQVSS